jgi:hypothetical protein
VAVRARDDNGAGTLASERRGSGASGPMAWICDPVLFDILSDLVDLILSLISSSINLYTDEGI